MEYRHYHILTFEVAPAELNQTRDWLYRQKCLGVETSSPEKQQAMIRAYFKGNKAVEGIRHSIERRFPHIHKMEATTIGLPVPTDQPANFETFNLVDGIWVSSSKGDAPESRQEIVLKPGLAFGSGRHDTTQLMAQMMNLMSHRPTSLLDVGTGSGILAIYAKYLGIERVAAVEISSSARKNALENFKKNGCGDIVLVSELKKTKGSFEVILANMVTPTLIALREEIVSRLAPGGILIFSGITREEAQELRQAYPGFRLEKELEQGDWLGMRLKDLTSSGSRH